MPEAIEVVFKRRRLEYFVNPDRVPIVSGDHVVVEADRTQGCLTWESEIRTADVADLPDGEQVSVEEP